MSRAIVDDEALDWAIRTDDPAFGDWDRFTLWLEANAGHAERYEQISAALANAAVIIEDLPAADHNMVIAANDRQSPRPARLGWAGGAIAAVMIGAVGLSVLGESTQPYVVATAAGQQREIQLADGSAIVVAGGSRLRLDHADERVATIDTGTAYFRIRHDERRPFTVHVAGMDVVDIGTVFDVSHDVGVTRVAVSEGEVVVAPGDAALHLTQGQAVRSEGNNLERQTIDPADVGRWREGMLSFDDAPLREVAAVLSRNGAHRVAVSPAIADMRFYGTLDVRRIGGNPALLGQLLGVFVRQAGKDWRLEPLH